MYYQMKKNYTKNIFIGAIMLSILSVLYYKCASSRIITEGLTEKTLETRVTELEAKLKFYEDMGQKAIENGVSLGGILIKETTSYLNNKNAVPNAKTP